MHIGIVSPCQSGPLSDLLSNSGGVDLGCGVYFMATLVRALIERGHHVSVITLSPEISDRRILEGPKLTYYVYPMRTQRRMRDLFKLEREGLREGILLARTDILHAHWTYEFAMACLETGLPTVVTSHDSGFQQLRFSRNLYRFGRLYMQIRVIRNARFLTAVSPYLANSLQWLTKTEIEVVPNPIEVDVANDNIHESASGPVRIATVLNGWGNRKNPKPAIKAFNLLRQRLSDAEMFMYGDEYEEGGPAWHWAKNKGVDQYIHFRGPVPRGDLLKKLRRMSILLHPALEESFGMAIIEAMALGLPVVGGMDSGAVPWVLDGGRAGFLTDVRNPEKIAQTLLTCIEQEEDRQRRQKNAFERVVSHFSPESVAQEYEKIYGRALSYYSNASNSGY